MIMNGMSNSFRLAQVRWRLAGQPVRLVVTAVGIGALALTAFAGLSATGKIDLTAASVLVAVVFGVVTIRQQQQSQRRQHTVDLITAFLNTDRLSAADAWIADRILTGRPITGDIPVAERSYVISMLDYYEFLAVLAQRGLVGVPLLIDLVGGSMTRCFNICRSYIEHRRTCDFPGLYSGLEFFVGVYLRRAGSTATVPPTASPATTVRRT